MNAIINLQTIRQVFEKIIPNQDGRTNINPFDFLVAFVFSFIGDTKILSIEGLR